MSSHQPASGEKISWTKSPIVWGLEWTAWRCHWTIRRWILFQNVNVSFQQLTKSWGSNENDLNKAQDARFPGGAPKVCHDVSFSMLLVIFNVPHQNCDNQDLRVVTSRSGYPKKRTLPLTEDFCLIVSKMRKVCEDKHRKKAFEEHYRHDSLLPNGAKLNCSIIEGTCIYP